ncbi:unnamed protein product [Hyaloperonospora brassicae]|uniref:Uncharacterized protein n=1 Tax=Hyaloperonospora brassicae TaxID=162125 RepID=A0AAV0TC63_HYABA|nr:unnamed protein product [Hyaloperonospora brassicae]
MASGPSSLWLERFYATFPTLREQQLEICRLYEATLDAQQTPRSSAFAREEEQKRHVHELQRELQEQDVQMLEAAETIEMLMRDVQVAREVARRAEKAQREAEADQMLRHVLQESDGEGSDAVAGQATDLETESAVDTEQRSAGRDKELEHEGRAVTEARERLSTLTSSQAVQETEQPVGIHVQRGAESVEQRTAGEMQQYRAMDGVRQELVAVLQAQVQALRLDKTSLDSAMVVCQRSIDKRIQVLEHDRQQIEAENCRLRAELARVLQSLNSLDVKLRALQAEDDRETATVQEKIEARLARAWAHQDQLARRVTNAEQKMALMASTAEVTGSRQLEEGQSQVVDEKQTLLVQLDEERRQSEGLRRSMSILQESMESALKELRDVEIELRAINSDLACGDAQHDTLAGLAKQVISDYTRFKQNGVCVEAFVASMQVEHLTSLMHAHLSRLRALRSPQEIYSTSTSIRYLPRSDSDESADDGWDTLDNHEAIAGVDLLRRETVQGD